MAELTQRLDHDFTLMVTFGDGFLAAIKGCRDFGRIGVDVRLEVGTSDRWHPDRIRNVMRGNAGGFETLLYDYHYHTSGGRSRHDYRQTVAAFKFLAALPQFDLRPENFLHRIGSAFGYQDIDFDSNPEFSKRYLLRGDEEQVRRLFTPSLLMFFEQLEKGWSVETSGPWLMAYRLEKQLKPQADLFREFIERTSSIAAAVKSQGGWA